MELNKKSFLFAVVVILFLTFGYQLLFQSKTLNSLKGSPWLDPGAAHWIDASTARITHNIIASGEIPVWDGYSGIGVPMVGDPHVALLSPFRLILYAFPTTAGWDVFMLLRLFFLIVFCYALLIRLGIRPWLALMYSLLYAYSGHVFYFLNFVHLNTLVFVPLFLEGVYCALTRQYKRSSIRICASLPLMFFGGGLVDILLLGILAVCIGLGYLASAIVTSIFNTSLTDKTLPPITKLVLYCIWGTLLSAPFLLPYLELRELSISPYSGRARGVFTDQLYFLAMFFNKLYVAPGEISHYYMRFHQHIHIITLPGFLFAFYALIKRPRGQFFFFGVLIFFFLYYAKLYDFGFIQTINQVALLRDIRFEKYQGIFHLCFYLISAFGINELIKHRNKYERIVFSVLCVLVAVLPVLYSYYGLSRPAPGKSVLVYALLPCLFMALIHVYIRLDDSFFKNRHINYLFLFLALLLTLGQIHKDMDNRLAKRKDTFVDKPLFKELRSLTQDYRSFLFSSGNPRTVAAMRIRDVRDYTDVHLQRFYELFKNHIENKTCWHFMTLCSHKPAKVNLELARYLGVRYLVMKKKLLNELNKNNYKQHKILKEIGGQVIVELTSPSSLITMHDNFEVSDKKKIFKKLVSGEIIKSQRVYLEEEIAPLNTDDGPLEYTVSGLTIKNNLITLQTKSNKDALLVAKFSDYPGWQAYIDNEQARIVKANYLYRGIRVPKGEHEIRFIYIPSSFILGMLIAILTLLVVWFLNNRSGLRKIAQSN